MSPASSPITLYEDQKLKVIRWSIILGVRWHELPSLESLEQYRLLQEQHFESLEEGTRAVVVSHADAGENRLSFDTGLRAAAEATLRSTQSNVDGMVQIIAGEGFSAASIRSVLSGIQLAIRPEYPFQIFGDTDSAYSWLEGLLLKLDQRDLAEGVNTVLLAELERVSEG